MILVHSLPTTCIIILETAFLSDEYGIMKRTTVIHAAEIALDGHEMQLKRTVRIYGALR